MIRSRHPVPIPAAGPAPATPVLKIEEDENAARGRLARYFLGANTILMLSGLAATVSLIWQWPLWIIIGVAWVFIPLAGKMDILANMPRAAKAYFIWFIAISVWGVIISPIFPAYSAFRAFVIAVTVMFSIWLCGSDKRSWRFMAMVAPCGILLNLFVTYLTMTNGAVRAFFVVHQALQQNSTSEFRYGGLWGNPNEASMQALILLVLSMWGPRWSAVLGFISGTTMIFLTASRTGCYILLIITFYYLYYFLRQSKRFRLATLVVLPMLAVFFLYGALPNLGGEEFTSKATRASTVAVSRVFDPTESQSDQSDTRLAGLHKWQPVIAREPWYGYGFDAEAGSTKTNNDAAYADMPDQGTHDEYLGVLVDDGIFGLIAFIAVLVAGVVTALRARQNAWNKAAMISMWMVFLIFSGFAHSTHLLLHGNVIIFLCFLTPALPALALLKAGDQEETDSFAGIMETKVAPGILATAKGSAVRDVKANGAGGFREPGRINGESNGSNGAHRPNGLNGANGSEAVQADRSFQGGGFRKPGRPKKPTAPESAN